MKIIAFPIKGSAYTETFYSMIEDRGVEVIEGEWSWRWLKNNLKKEDVVHIHWPSFYYAARGGSFALLKSFLRFTVIVLAIKSRSKRLVWTAHNLLPHQKCSIPIVDIWVRKLILRLSDAIFLHGAEAEKVFSNRFSTSKRKCRQIPHGNWMADYPHMPTKAQARNDLGLAENGHIYLAFGRCRPYKNTDSLASAFLEMASENDYLLIAGRFTDRRYLATIVAFSEKDSRIRIDDKFISEEDVPKYFSACDVVCNPYREILTSGTTMLAFGFGKPVISIARGFLNDVITNDTGILVNPDCRNSLTNAMVEARNRYWSDGKIKDHARKFTFEEAAQIFLQEVDMLPSK